MNIVNIAAIHEDEFLPNISCTCPTHMEDLEDSITLLFWALAIANLDDCSRRRRASTHAAHLSNACCACCSVVEFIY